MAKFVFPSHIYPKLPSANKFGDILEALLSNKREAILGRASSPDKFFTNIGNREQVGVPLDIRKIIWDMHNHPGGYLRPSVADLKSGRLTENLEMGIIDPLERRIMQIYDPQHFQNLDNKFLPSYANSPIYSHQFAPVLNRLVGALTEGMIKKAIGPETIIQSIPLRSHPIFKEWLKNYQGDASGFSP